MTKTRKLTGECPCFGCVKRHSQWLPGLFHYHRAVYGYANQSYDLELVAKGSGLDELTEELNSCKILYAFCRVLDPNTELPKNVLINWVCISSIL